MLHVIYYILRLIYYIVYTPSIYTARKRNYQIIITIYTWNDRSRIVKVLSVCAYIVWIYSSCISNIVPVLFICIAGSFGRSPKRGVGPKFFAHLQFADDKTNATETNGRVVIPRFFSFTLFPTYTLSLFCFGFFSNAISREVSASSEPNYSRASIKKKKCGFTNRGPGILCFSFYILYIIIIIVPWLHIIPRGETSTRVYVII